MLSHLILTDFAAVLRWCQHGTALDVDHGKSIPYSYPMIIGRITAKAQTTVPLAVRRALELSPGDDVAWEIEGGQAVVTKASAPERSTADFSMFTEWADELDSAYDAL